jgi:hypothetical protein
MAGGVGGGAAEDCRASALVVRYDLGRHPCFEDSSMKFAALMLLPMMLIGCGTPEYRAANASCEADWFRNIPPSYYDTLVEQLRPVKRPTGRTTCVTRGDRTYCDQQMMTEFVPYQTVVTVDRYKPERDAEIARCTADACLRRYGNVECK